MLNTLKDATVVYSRDEVFGMRAHTEFAPGILEGTRFYIVAETPDGFRFRLRQSICLGSLETSEDGFQYWRQDLTEAARVADALVTKITKHLQAGGSLNPDHWYPIQGVYGSAGWDEMAELEIEMMEG